MVHSVGGDGLWDRNEVSEFLYHGTVERFLQSIRAEGYIYIPFFFLGA